MAREFELATPRAGVYGCTGRVRAMDAVESAKALTGSEGSWWIEAAVRESRPDTLLSKILWKHSGQAMAILDGGVVVASFLLSYYVRFYVQRFSLRAVPVADPMPYLKGAVLLGVLWVLFIWREKGYDGGFKGIGVPGLGIAPVFSGGCYAVLVLMAVSFMYHILLSRQVYVTTGLLAVGGMLAIRVLWRQMIEDCARNGGVVQRVVIVGTASGVSEVHERLKNVSRVVRIVGWIGRGIEHAQRDNDRGGLPFLGPLDEIRRILGETAVDTVVISSDFHGDGSDECRSGMMDLVNFCEERKISLFAMPDSYDVSVKQTEVGAFSSFPLIKLQDASLDPLYGLVKRAFDVIVAATGILVGFPLWLIVAAAIKLETPGPVFFVQTRAGRHGRPFRMYKFRTMVADAEKRLGGLVDFNALNEPVFKIRNDPRVTRIGRFLRRTGLDEVPQLINVLKGEMSLVGPRPEELALVMRYNHWQRRRLKAKPGITGLQQVRNRGEPRLAERIKHDLVYLKHQGLFLDILIILKTLAVMAKGTEICRREAVRDEC